MELGQFHLQLAFPGAGALGKDIEDEPGAIEHGAGEDLLQIARLRGRKLIVEDDGVHAEFTAGLGKFLGLAGADEGGGVDGLQLLDALAHDVRSGGAGQLSQFGHGVRRRPRGAGLQFHAHEKDAFGLVVGVVEQSFQIKSGQRIARWLAW